MVQFAGKRPWRGMPRGREAEFVRKTDNGKNKVSTREYRLLRKILLHGRRTKHRIAALNDMIASPTPPSARLLGELLRQNLPDELALTVMSLKRTYFGGNDALVDRSTKSDSY